MEEEKPLEALENAIGTDPRDWSANATDAWIYGIVVGWGKKLVDVAAKHDWDAEKLSRLRQLRVKFHELE